MHLYQTGTDDNDLHRSAAEICRARHAPHPGRSALTDAARTTNERTSVIFCTWLKTSGI